MFFQKTNKLFSTLAKKITATVEKFLRKYNKIATKETIESLEESTTVTLNKSIEVSLYGSNVFEYIEKGRAPGSKMPPEGSLLEWMKSKRIDNSLEFPIRRSIGIKGIEPKPVLESSFVEIQNDSFNLSENMLIAISQDLEQVIEKGLSFNTIMI